MIWLLTYLTIKMFEIIIGFFTLPFRLIGYLINPKSKKQPKKYVPYSYEEMYMYDEFFD